MRGHAINVISIRIARHDGGRARCPRQSPSRLDLKPPDRNSSFYRRDSFPPARAKQTAMLADTRGASATLLLSLRRRRRCSTRIYYAFRARKRDVYYRACLAISASRPGVRFCSLPTRSRVLGSLNRPLVLQVCASFRTKRCSLPCLRLKRQENTERSTKRIQLRGEVI
jgi:hypothetical protein